MELNGSNTLLILGTRGIPACHGGFETFAENFAIYMESKGWRVVVYCQEDGNGPIRKELWNGIERVIIPIAIDNALGTILFDLRAILHAASQRGKCLTLGYNTAILNFILFLGRRKTAMNMDGIEWSRKKWSTPAKIWLYINEYAGAKLSRLLIADNPEISRHLQRHTSSTKIRMIPYGAPSPAPDDGHILRRFDLEPGRYAILVARPEPENSILEIVKAWSSKPRGIPLVILGTYYPGLPYHKAVLDSASSEVRFVGAIYDKEIVSSLRLHASFYLHGHQVGGTNPSLIEAMACGNALLCHDNRFNRWVAGDGASYFDGADECASRIDEFLSSPDLVAKRAKASIARQAEHFTLDGIHEQYRDALERL